jgi:hypothetical protein
VGSIYMALYVKKRRNAALQISLLLRCCFFYNFTFKGNLVVSVMLRMLFCKRVALRQGRSAGISGLTSAPLKIASFLASFYYKEPFVVLFKAIPITGHEKHLLSNTVFMEMVKTESLSL